MGFFETLAAFSDIAIVILLAIQSYALMKVLPYIIKTANNSSYFTETLSGVGEKFGIKMPKKLYPLYLTKAGIKNCKNYDDPKHVHDHNCF